MHPSKILLLCKISTFQYYQKLPDKCRMDSDEIDRFKETHHTHVETIDVIEAALGQRGLTYDKKARGALEDYQGYDLVITVGGDGTFLEGARYLCGQPILGVNSDPSWSVGRLCPANRETFTDFLDAVLTDRNKVVSINRLQAAFQKSGIVKTFVNDVLIAHADPASMSRYVFSLNGECEEQRGSGIWFATAAGSTGAIRSAGGAVLDLQSRDFQYLPRELYQGWNSDTYRFRGGLLSSDDQVGVTSLMMGGMVFLDGSHQRIPFEASEHIAISPAKIPVDVVALPAE